MRSGKWKIDRPLMLIGVGTLVLALPLIPLGIITLAHGEWAGWIPIGVSPAVIYASLVAIDLAVRPINRCFEWKEK